MIIIKIGNIDIDKLKSLANDNVEVVMDEFVKKPERQINTVCEKSKGVRNNGK